MRTLWTLAFRVPPLALRFLQLGPTTTLHPSCDGEVFTAYGVPHNSATSSGDWPTIPSRATFNARRLRSIHCLPDCHCYLKQSRTIKALSARKALEAWCPTFLKLQACMAGSKKLALLLLSQIAVSCALVQLPHIRLQASQARGTKRLAQLTP